MLSKLVRAQVFAMLRDKTMLLLFQFFFLRGPPYSVLVIEDGVFTLLRADLAGEFLKLAMPFFCHESKDFFGMTVRVFVFCSSVSWCVLRTASQSLF